MSAPTSPPLSRRQKSRQIECKVLLLDDTILTVHIPAKGSGQVLYDEVIRKLQLLEADYFDLEYTDVRQMHNWLDHDKPVLRQLPRHSLELRFVVKFYTPDPGQLEEDYTRYLFALQVRRDLCTGALPCQEHTAVLLASYIVQAELGDFSDEFEVPGYLKDVALLPRQTEELELRIAEHHRDHAGQTPAVAEFNLLDTARKVDLYGIQSHPAKDHEGVPLHLAVAHLGVLVFQNQTKINTFSWAKIRKLSFKRKKFLVKLHPEGYGYYKDIVEFYFESRNDCKNFWKKCLEHHAFFRCHSVKRLPRNKTRLVSRGSSFRYCGRTQKQLAEYVRENCNRRPEFQRSTSLRTISLSHSVATTPKTGTLKSRAEHHLSHPNIRSSSSSHAICVERAHARERYRNSGRSDTAPSRSLQTFRAMGTGCDIARQTLTPPGCSKKGADDALKARRAQMELRNGTLDDFNLSYFKMGYGSDKQNRDAAYHDNMSQDSYQLTESHDSLDFERVEPVGDGGAVDGKELCRQLEDTREGERREREEGKVEEVVEESPLQDSVFMEGGDVAEVLGKDGGKDGEAAVEEGVEDREGWSDDRSAAVSVRRKRLSHGDAVGIRDDGTVSLDCRVTGSPSHVVNGSQGQEVIGSQGSKVRISSGHEVAISQGLEVTGSPGPEVKIPPCQKFTSSPGHEVSTSPGHEVTGSSDREVRISPGHEVTSAPGQKVVDANEIDVHETKTVFHSPENIPDIKDFQRTCGTVDIQECASSGNDILRSPGHKVNISPGHKVNISQGHKVNISPGRHNSTDNFLKSVDLVPSVESARSVSEAESPGSSHVTDLAGLGDGVTRSPGHDAPSSTMAGHTGKSEKVSVEHKESALDDSGDLTDTVLPPGVDILTEPPGETNEQEVPRLAKKPKSSPDLEALQNGQADKDNRKGENEDVSEVPKHAGDNVIAGTDSEFPYILHKRHLASKGEQTDIVVQSSVLPRRSFRSRSPSPGKKRTKEEQRAELEKVKATLSSLAFQRKNPSVGNRRILDFVVYSRLPPRDSYSSKDDSISPTTLERALAAKGKLGGGSGTKDISRTDFLPTKSSETDSLPTESSETDSLPAKSSEADSLPPGSSEARSVAVGDRAATRSTVLATENQSLKERIVDESLDARSRGGYVDDETAGDNSADLGAGELASGVETSNSTKPGRELGGGTHVEGGRGSFPPSVVGASMCSLEEFMMDVDLPAPIVESEEYDTSTSNSGEASVMEQSGREEDVFPSEGENVALEERLAQVVLPSPPPPPLEGPGGWSDDAVSMELYEPPAMLELLVDTDGADLGVSLPRLEADCFSGICGSVDLFNTGANLRLFGAERGVDGDRFCVDDLDVFESLRLETNDLFRVTSSPLPSPPPPPFPWCDDVEIPTDPGLESSVPMVDMEKGLLVGSLSCGEEISPGSDSAVDRIVRIEVTPVLDTYTNENLLSGKDPLIPVENNPLIAPSTTSLDQSPNLLLDETNLDSVSSMNDTEQVCGSVVTIPLVRCSLDEGPSSGSKCEAVCELGDVAATGFSLLSPAVYSDLLLHDDISDEDDVERPYTEHSLHDLYRNLEAEALARPFHVPISADIPLNVSHSDDGSSASRSPHSYEGQTDSLCIEEPFPDSFVEPMFGEPRFDVDLLDRDCFRNPVPNQSQTLSLHGLESPTSKFSSNKP